MGKIKGWKKIGKIRTDNAGKYELWVPSPSRYGGYQRVKLRHKYPRFGYTVILVPPFGMTNLKEYFFMKKAQALKFATLWMKKHPRG